MVDDLTFELYRQWDERANGMEFQPFARKRLKAECELSGEQTKVLVEDVIVPFVDDMIALVRKWLYNSHSVEVQVWGQLHRALKKPPADPEIAPFINDLKQKWFHEPVPTFVDRLCEFVGKWKAGSVRRLFSDGRRFDVPQTAYLSAEAMELAKVDAALARGEYLKAMLAGAREEKSVRAKAAEDVEKLPRCVREALDSDLMSDEECLLMKLTSLDYFIKAVRVLGEQADWDWTMAVPIAIEMCRVACRENIDAHVTLKHRSFVELDQWLDTPGDFRITYFEAAKKRLADKERVKLADGLWRMGIIESAKRALRSGTRRACCRVGAYEMSGRIASDLQAFSSLQSDTHIPRQNCRALKQAMERCPAPGVIRLAARAMGLKATVYRFPIFNETLQFAICAMGVKAILVALVAQVKDALRDELYLEKFYLACVVRRARRIARHPERPSQRIASGCTSLIGRAEAEINSEMRYAPDQYARRVLRRLVVRQAVRKVMLIIKRVFEFIYEYFLKGLFP